MRAASSPRRRPSLRLPALLAATLALGASGCGEPEPTPRHVAAPVILVSLDTVRRDAVTGFGAPPGATPHLERLAREGASFDSAVSASHHTAPSHATMLTGNSAPVHGVALGHDARTFAVPAEIPTLAETLRAAGYRTGGFTDGVQVTAQRRFDRGFDVFQAEFSGIPAKAAAIERFLDESAGRPFFLFAHTYRAHQPYRAPRAALERLLAGYHGTFRAAALRSLEFEARAGSRPTDWGAFAAELTRDLSWERARTAEDLRFLRAVYEAGCAAADEELGVLLAILERRGLLEHAVLAVTSDHGEAFGEHSNSRHSDLFDEIVRVPLVVRLPRGFGAGRRLAETFPATDLMPTLLDVVGVQPLREVEGVSWAETLLAGARPPERVAYAAQYLAGSARPACIASRTEHGKRLDFFAAPADLPRHLRNLAPAAFFDLQADPLERLNVAPAHPGYAALGRSLTIARREWDALRRRLGVGGEAPSVSLDPEAQQALEGLGYLGGK